MGGCTRIIRFVPSSLSVYLFPVTDPPTVAERPQRARRLGPVDTASEMVP
jgi:hypothetical protein